MSSSVKNRSNNHLYQYIDSKYQTYKGNNSRLSDYIKKRRSQVPPDIGDMPDEYIAQSNEVQGFADASFDQMDNRQLYQALIKTQNHFQQNFNETPLANDDTYSQTQSNGEPKKGFRIKFKANSTNQGTGNTNTILSKVKESKNEASTLDSEAHKTKT